MFPASEYRCVALDPLKGEDERGIFLGEVDAAAAALVSTGADNCDVEAGLDLLLAFLAPPLVLLLLFTAMSSAARRSDTDKDRESK